MRMPNEITVWTCCTAGAMALLFVSALVRMYA
jgi:hypothetical protein